MERVKGGASFRAIREVCTATSGEEHEGDEELGREKEGRAKGGRDAVGRI